MMQYMEPKELRGDPQTDDQTEREVGQQITGIIELTGAIKWFDVSKGYGFIVPDNGMSDIFLDVRCLRRDGFQVAREGARVVVEVLQRPRGLQAFRLLSMDESTAVHPAVQTAAAHACNRVGGQRARAGAGEMVQSVARVRLPHSR